MSNIKLTSKPKNTNPVYIKTGHKTIEFYWFYL